MKKNAIAVIQARMSSTRLPGKVLLPLAKEPLLWHIYNRVSRCRGIDKIIIATSKDKSDDEIEEFCRKNNIEFYRGSLENVLGRFIGVIDRFSPGYLVRITGDIPFPWPSFIDGQIKVLKLYDGDMSLSKDHSWFFEGQGAHSVRSLREAYLSERKEDKEHVGLPYIFRNLDKLRIVNLVIPKEYILSDCRLTIDTPADYQLISKIYKDLYREGKFINIFMLKDWIERNKKLLKDTSMKAYYYDLQKTKIEKFKKANIVGTYVIKKEDFIK